MNNGDIRSRVLRLSNAQRKLLKDRLSTQQGERQGTAQLVGYISTTSDIELESLKKHLAASLPNYMVPGQIMTLKTIPKLPNGKVDFNALPSPERKTSIEQTQWENFDEKERQLARIWQEVLGIELVGLHDNFFEIGGDSILSIQIVSKARNAGIDLTPNQLFKHQTIAELVQALELPAESELTDEPDNQRPATGGLSPEDLMKVMQQINQHRDKDGQ